MPLLTRFVSVLGDMPSFFLASAYEYRLPVSVVFLTLDALLCVITFTSYHIFYSYTSFYCRYWNYCKKTLTKRLFPAIIFIGITIITVAIRSERWKHGANGVLRKVLC